MAQALLESNCTPDGPGQDTDPKGVHYSATQHWTRGRPLGGAGGRLIAREAL